LIGKQWFAVKLFHESSRRGQLPLAPGGSAVGVALEMLTKEPTSLKRARSIAGGMGPSCYVTDLIEIIVL
jgi:hypothetical protein